MALNIMKQVATCYHRPLVNKAVRFYSVYEPPYLSIKSSGPQLYPVLHIQIKGYTYPLLEKFQSFIGKVANNLDIDIDEGFALPHQEHKVQRYKKESTIVDSEYTLKLYERNVVLSNVTSTKCPILIRILEASLPIGVTLHLDVYNPEIQKKRYIPDKVLLDLKSTLTEMQKPKD